jgi:fimbrial isopeptide formation D2 family protein
VYAYEICVRSEKEMKILAVSKVKRNKISKKTLAFLLSFIMLAQFLILSDITVGNAFASYLSGYNITSGANNASVIPAFLRDGEVRVGKAVEHNIDGTVTVTLSAWGNHYYVCDNCIDNSSGEMVYVQCAPCKAHESCNACVPGILCTPYKNTLEPRLPLSETDPFVYVTDETFQFLVRPGTVSRPEELDVTNNGAVVWKVNQSHIVGAAPVTIQYTLELNPDYQLTNNTWELDYWYTTSGALSKFTPCFLDPEFYPYANPFYFTKSEVTYDSFTMSMNWNNGNGLNSGTITDKILGATITFGSNASPEFQSAYYPPRYNGKPYSVAIPNAPYNTVAGPMNWIQNVRYPGKPVMYYWHLEWEKANTVKSYWFTVRDLDEVKSPTKGDITADVVYEVFFPNPGGNTSQPASRNRVSDEYFQRSFEPEEQSKLFEWDGNQIKMVMDNIGQVLLTTDAWLNTGTLRIAKNLEGWYDTDWNVTEYSLFAALVRVFNPVTGLFDRYMTFSDDPNPLPQGTHSGDARQYVYTGITGSGTAASTALFCTSDPAVITGIPLDLTWYVEEYFESENDFIKVTYTHHNTTSENPIPLDAVSGATRRVTVTNDYSHGVGYLEINKLFSGFASDWGVNDSTIFHVRVWDKDYENYLLFRGTPGADGTYRCIGNTVNWLSEGYSGTPISVLPISANNSIKLSNLWTWGKYEVQEVYETSPGVWEPVRELTFVPCPEGCNGEDPDCLIKCVACPSDFCEWKTDDDWNWSVTYSENNGLRDLQFNETQVVTVTNRYKRSSGKMSIFKALEGSPENHAVNNNTVFQVRVSDEAHENFLVFDETQRTQDGSYRVVGHLDCGDGACIPYSSRDIAPYGTIHFSQQPTGGWNAILTELPLSVNKPVLISNLWTGDNHFYRVEEVSGASNTISYSLNKGVSVPSLNGISVPAGDDASMIINITNTYEHVAGNMAIYKELAGFYAYWNVDDDTVFFTKVHDEAYNDSALVFEPQGDGSFKYIGHLDCGSACAECTDDFGYVTEIPFSVNAPALLTGMETGALNKFTLNELLVTGKSYDDFFAPSYSENGYKATSGECLNITVTNTFMRDGIDMRFSKEITGSYSERGATNNTEFLAVVRDISDDTQLIFVRELDGTYRCIGHLDCGDPSCRNTPINKNGVMVHYSEQVGADYICEIPFSVNNPAELTNLWPGQIYRVDELDVPNSTASYNYINNPHNILDLVITNTYEPIVYQVIYNANWPVVAPRDGDEPPTVKYPAGVDVVVEGNPGELRITDWAKLGWALEPTSLEPDFWQAAPVPQIAPVNFMLFTPFNSGITDKDNSGFKMPAMDVDLYGVWRPRPLVRDVLKSASGSHYQPGQPISYNISFLLPPEVDYYEYITIADVFPESKITFDAISSLKVGGTLIDNPETLLTESPGRIEIKLEWEHFNSHGGDAVELELDFTIGDTTEGIVRNTTRVYVKTAYEDLPDESDGADAEIVVKEGWYGIIYNPNWPGGKRGSGEPPSDDDAYETSDPVTVKPNEGGLTKSGYKFIGWARLPNATEPDFVIEGLGSESEVISLVKNIFVEDENIALYGVWEPWIELEKIPETPKYVPGTVMDYTISFQMPADMDSYDRVRIEDVIPPGLDYAGDYAVFIGDYDASGDIELEIGSLGGSPTVYAVIDDTLLPFSEGRDVRLILSFAVDTEAEGAITNTANVYFTPENGTESIIPIGTDDAVTLPFGAENEFPTLPDDFEKTATSGSTFSGVGATVNYTISFTLPDNVAGYEGLLVYDVLPDSLTFVSAAATLDGAMLAVSQASGKVSVYVNESAITANAGKAFKLNITATVNANWQSGNITNTAEFYIQQSPTPPNPDNDIPEITESETITPAPPQPPTPPQPPNPPQPPSPPDDFPIMPSEFMKQATTGAAFNGVGDTIVFTIGLRLPDNLTGYEGLLIYDRLPYTLDFISGELIIDGGPAGGAYQDGDNVRAYIGKAALEAAAGKRIELIVTAKVNSLWTGGSIQNTAELYIQREPSAPPVPGTNVPPPGTAVSLPGTNISNPGTNTPDVVYTVTVIPAELPANIIPHPATAPPVTTTVPPAVTTPPNQTAPPPVSTTPPPEITTPPATRASYDLISPPSPPDGDGPSGSEDYTSSDNPRTGISFRLSFALLTFTLSLCGILCVKRFKKRPKSLREVL